MPKYSSTFSLVFLLFLGLIGINSVLAVFYRNIPFRLKTSETEEEWANREGNGGGGGHETIGQLLDQIENEALRVALERSAASEKASKVSPRRIVRLIPLRTKDEMPAALGGELARMKGAPSSPSPPLHSHLMALRPDYAFRNVADFLRNFFDSRIDSRKLATKKSVKEDGLDD